MKKAVIIGITYADSEDKDDVLEASAIDVRNMREFLTKYGYELRILTDDVNDSSPDKRYPTDLEIRDALKWLVKDASAGDQLFLHYSGHGQQINTNSPTESDGMDEVMRPAKGESIRDNELRAILVDNLPPDCQLVALFDCCHSGTLLDLHHRAKAERSPKSKKLEIVRDQEKALARVWRFGGAAVYSARLNPPKSPLSEDRSATYPLPNQFQIPITDPSLLWENRKVIQDDELTPYDEKGDIFFPVISPLPLMTVPLQDGPGISLAIQQTIPVSLLGCTPPPRTLTKNPVKKWVTQLQKVMRPRVICDAPLVDSPAQSRRSSFIQSRFSCSLSRARKLSTFSPTSPTLPMAPQSENTDQATRGSIAESKTTTVPLQLPTPESPAPEPEQSPPVVSDIGYTVERRNTFAAFHGPSEGVKRVITYSACTDAQNIYDDETEGGLLTSHFIRFMNQKRRSPITLSGMLVELTKRFAEINKNHQCAIPGQPPTALLCTADWVKLDDPLNI